mgnify:CR=1 FL=1
MCKDEIASVNSNGSLDDLDSITSKDIYDTYLDMINESIKEFSKNYFTFFLLLLPFVNRLSIHRCAVEAFFSDTSCCASIPKGRMNVRKISASFSKLMCFILRALNLFSCCVRFLFPCDA